ncbi:MAG TPA: bifunctional 4-hydroxy-2-oxoglutarate aldolase/2-dehydro-3-deoxy-phosphogluconate aldolase [Bryobacteraceae bacterium]|nr:bifunctional 4-hydroxy-2-oxoglutarate aldolase/2-dehydro-3-deoxy-phosphogluconate aldolase [Bryobacteraceae bacterium]
MSRHQVRRRIEEIGIIPAVRAHSAEDAVFAAEAVTRSGIPIVEITMTIPGALEVVARLARNHGEVVVGAGTVLDLETARRCLEAGAHFITSTGFDPEVVEFAIREDVAIFPGALTPTEVMLAWKARPDFVKIFPCAPMGGPGYIHALRGPFHDVPLIAAGGITQHNAVEYLSAGAVALGIGGELIPQEAIRLRQEHRIAELARRLLALIKVARKR